MVGEAAVTDPVVPVGAGPVEPGRASSEVAGGACSPHPSAQNADWPARMRVCATARRASNPRRRSVRSRSDRAVSSPSQTASPYVSPMWLQGASHAPIVECGLAVDLDVDEAVETTEDRQHTLGLVVTWSTDVPVRALLVVAPGPDQERVAHLEPPGRRGPRRLQDHGSGHVATARGNRPVTRPETEPTRVPVEDRREDARAVHPRERQPLDVPAGRYERTDLAVRQQRVVGDRRERAAAERDVTVEAFAARQLQLDGATVALDVEVHPVSFPLPEGCSIICP